MIADRKTWLKERQKGVMSSDIASLCGIGFNTAEQVYAEKIAPEPIDLAPNERMATGTALEPFIAKRFEVETSLTTFDPPEIVWIADGRPFGASIDRLVSQDLTSILEMKSVFPPFDWEDWGPAGTDEIPEKYILQTTWQCGVADYEGAYVGVLFVGNGFRIYRVKFNRALFESLTAIAEAFWARVSARSGMDGWAHPLIDRVVVESKRVQPGKSVFLDKDVAAIYAEFERLGKIEADARKAGEQKRELKPQLEKAFGEAQFGVLPDGRRLKRNLVKRDGYEVEPCQYTTFKLLRS